MHSSLKSLESATSANPAKAASPGTRLLSIDALRGLVMVIMALDHVRDFFHSDAALFSPTDLSRTTLILFLTRWITHYCLPVFMFAAGMGVYLYGRGHTKGELSRFLWTRGVWFIALELTVMQFAYNFNFSLRFLILLLILWIFGICMIAMASLVYVPMRGLGALSIAIIVLHNCLDGVRAAEFGSGAWAWNLLHQPGVIPVAGKMVLVTYTFLPWIAVMAAGFCFGRVFQMEPETRRRIMLKLGLAMTTAFIALRAVNHYGDPAPWTHQKSALFTVLSFLNCTKYPGSLDFLLMTLGPALLVLAWFDWRTLKPANPLVVFGRVPMFYFVLHFYLIHVLAVLGAWLRYGSSAARFVFNPLPSMGGPEKLFPPNFGYSLWTVYGVWLLVLVLLYPVCRWFASVKSRRRDWWLSYL
jgi:uncharacterized membrane protein